MVRGRLLFDDTEGVALEFLYLYDLCIWVEHRLIGLRVESPSRIWLLTRLLLLLLVPHLKHTLIQLFLGGQFMLHLHDRIEIRVLGIFLKLLLHLVALVGLVVNEIRPQTTALTGIKITPR